LGGGGGRTLAKFYQKFDKAMIIDCVFPIRCRHCPPLLGLQVNPLVALILLPAVFLNMDPLGSHSQFYGDHMMLRPEQQSEQD
jgi:hypothetical protein